jgi:lipoprotein-anchoring transpeptidase ErfK/SrfK
VKLLSLLFVLIVSLAVNQAYAQDAFNQPLTRVDCEKAEMGWNDNTNVCGASPAAATIPDPEAAEVSRQPLTRDECDKVSMTWDETANVCGRNSEGSTTQAATQEANPAGSAILINIDKAAQRMTVFLDGVERYHWPVSTGRPAYSTPSGTYTARSMNEIWYSKQWDNAPMPHAVFFTKEGHAIHGTNEVKRLGTPASHGCVRISPQNAATLYALVAKNGLENTKVTLVGLTPGGEGKVASSAPPKAPLVQPRKRNGFFARLFGRR